MEENIDLDNLWGELLDEVLEVEGDLKNNRRGLRHLRSLRMTIIDIDNALKGMTKKKKGLF